MHTSRILTFGFLVALVGCGSQGVAETDLSFQTSEPVRHRPGRSPDLCLTCLTADDCLEGSACVQIGGDDFCASAADNGCADGLVSSSMTALDGAEVEVCVPASGSCTSEGCAACTADEVCDLGTGTCEPAASRPNPSDTIAPAAVSGSVGQNGGSVSHLFFAVTGDTRPNSTNSTTTYPTAIIQKIFADAQGMSPAPQFFLATGDFMFANTAAAADAQLQTYLQAAQHFSGPLFPVMGNHECDGYTTSNCSTSTTPNYTSYKSHLLAPYGRSEPYYTIPFTTLDGTWTAKMVVIACNTWNTTQKSWLSAELAKPTRYTIVAQHEPMSATTAPCISAVKTILAQYSYDLLLVGHTHTFKYSGKEVVVGIGGAPLTNGGHYGLATVEQAATGFKVTEYDYATVLPVQSFTVPYACASQCSGKVCGDDGCGGLCGPACPGNETCSAAGQCVGACKPVCSGRVCGDDQCGGTCGPGCSGTDTCNAAGQCIPTCKPVCTGRVCGADQCGGTCGPGCSGTDTCNASGQCVPTSGTAKVIINEILANEPGSDTTAEFVELLNVGTAAADLSGWTLSDSAAVRHTFASATQLAAGKAVVVFGKASAIPSGLTNAVGSSTGTLHLGNSSDTVTLKNTSGAVVDSYAYTSGLANVDGVSMNRAPDGTAGAGFVLHTALTSLKSSPGKRDNGNDW